MTTEEKLQHFYDVSVGEAKDEAQQMIEDHKKYLASLLEDHKKMRKHQAELEIKAETANARREINKALSSEQLLIKRQWSKRQNEMKDKLFAEVKQRLVSFMESPAYDGFLENKIREAKEFAGEDELTVYLSPADAEKVDVLSKKTGLTLGISQEDFLGGVRAVISDKNILIDNSFLEMYASERKQFSFDGGLIHE